MTLCWPNVAVLPLNAQLSSAAGFSWKQLAASTLQDRQAKPKLTSTSHCELLRSSSATLD